MKMIQTIADIEELRVRSTFPLSYLQSIESQFYEWFEAEGADESITAFRLSNDSCMYHLEYKHDAEFILNQLLNVEFVDVEELEGVSFFRIGIMNDHQMNLVFFLQGTLESKIEQWLQG